jgi:hypothetical protein
VRGTKLGLISIIGKSVTGSTSPRASFFAKAGSMSLLRETNQCLIPNYSDGHYPPMKDSSLSPHSTPGGISVKLTSISSKGQ